MIVFDNSYLLLGKSFKIAENIVVNNPKLKEIFEFGEESYFSLVSSFVMSPADYKIQLDNIGIDFEQISDFEFFCLNMQMPKVKNYNLLFGGLDFSQAELYICKDTQEQAIQCGDVIINELAYRLMSEFIRKINGLPLREPEKFSSAHAKQYVMEQERVKLKYAKKESFKPMLLPFVSGLVNCTESSYDYNSVMELSISQLHDAIGRVNKIKHYNDVMTGVYSGTIKYEDIKQADINWLS